MSHATTDDFDLHMDALDVDARVFRDAGDDITAAELAALADRTADEDLDEIALELKGGDV